MFAKKKVEITLENDKVVFSGFSNETKLSKIIVKSDTNF